MAKKKRGKTAGGTGAEKTVKVLGKMIKHYLKGLEVTREEAAGGVGVDVSALNRIVRRGTAYVSTGRNLRQYLNRSLKRAYDRGEDSLSEKDYPLIVSLDRWPSRRKVSVRSEIAGEQDAATDTVVTAGIGEDNVVRLLGLGHFGDSMRSVLRKAIGIEEPEGKDCVGTERDREFIAHVRPDGSVRIVELTEWSERDERGARGGEGDGQVLHPYIKEAVKASLALEVSPRKPVVGPETRQFSVRVSPGGSIRVAEIVDYHERPLVTDCRLVSPRWGRYSVVLRIRQALPRSLRFPRSSMLIRRKKFGSF